MAEVVGEKDGSGLHHKKAALRGSEVACFYECVWLIARLV